MYFTKYEKNEEILDKCEHSDDPFKNLNFHSSGFDWDASRGWTPFNAVFVSVGYNPSLSPMSSCYDKHSPFLGLSLQLDSISQHRYLFLCTSRKREKLFFFSFFFPQKKIATTLKCMCGNTYQSWFLMLALPFLGYFSLLLSPRERLLWVGSLSHLGFPLNWYIFIFPCWCE